MGDSYRNLKEKYKRLKESHDQISLFYGTIMAAFDCAETLDEPDYVHDAAYRWRQYENGQITLEEASDISRYDNAVTARLAARQHEQAKEV